jgi:hypothetical protein
MFTYQGRLRKPLAKKLRDPEDLLPICEEFGMSELSWFMDYTLRLRDFSFGLPTR